MLKALSLALLLAFVSPTFAQDAEPAASCLSVEQAKEGLSPVTVEADLSGDALKNFNANYSRDTKQAPPNFDRVLILSKPDAMVFVLIAIREGCVKGAQPMLAAVFKRMMAPVRDNGAI